MLSREKTNKYLKKLDEFAKKFLDVQNFNCKNAGKGINTSSTVCKWIKNEI
jgi:hypothetical protein